MTVYCTIMHGHRNIHNSDCIAIAIDAVAKLVRVTLHYIINLWTARTKDLWRVRFFCTIYSIALSIRILL